MANSEKIPIYAAVAMYRVLNDRSGRGANFNGAGAYLPRSKVLKNKH